jgi:hypothetical protein
VTIETRWLWQRLLSARYVQLRFGHEHVMLGERAMVPALGDALGKLSAFQVLQRKKAKAFRVQNWIMAGQFHLFAPESLGLSVNAGPEGGVPRLIRRACRGQFLNAHSC